MENRRYTRGWEPLSGAGGSGEQREGRRACRKGSRTRKTQGGRTQAKMGRTIEIHGPSEKRGDDGTTNGESGADWGDRRRTNR